MTLPVLPHVAVILAVHKPDMELLAVQLASYRRQKGVLTSLFAVLDGEATCNDQDVRTELRDAGAVLIEERVGLGVRRAFLSGLEKALEATDNKDALFAFMDQDDRWHEEKLSASVESLLSEEAQLVHCDARVVGAEGRMIAPSLHVLENRQCGESLLGFVLLNTVTGMTAVFTRRAARTCLSLERGLQSAVLHDHLMAVAASACGRVVFLDRVLLDYVSHGNNTVGPVKWRKQPVWSRQFSAAAANRYWETTGRVFADRRSIVEALKREGLAPGNLCEIFLVGDHHSSFRRLAAAYGRSVLQMRREGQSRGAGWLMRFFPLALRRHYLQVANAAPPK